MKHLKKGRKFNRVKNQREAMLKTLLGSLIMQGKIKTTEAKAKEAKSLIDRIILQAKKTKNEKQKASAMRILKNQIPQIAVRKVTGEFLEKFEGRNSGYARVVKLEPRKKDSARMAIVEFV